ncbi:MAG: hypothetical protein NC900_05205 [Candidatus Omnitrophica bacterium]|nr:hypothetical protein [Candidatus Omnitrophota bacterium]
MKKIIFFILIFFAFILKNVNAQNLVSSSTLIEKAEEFDGKAVVYRGEIIGEMMCRKNGCWLNVNDGNLSLGIWIPKELNFSLRYAGGYKIEGDRIEIEGIFHYSCVEHLGEMDIHANKIRLIKEGRLLEEKVDIKKINSAIIIWGFLCIILISSKLKRA